VIKSRVYSSSISSYEPGCYIGILSFSLFFSSVKISSSFMQTCTDVHVVSRRKQRSSSVQKVWRSLMDPPTIYTNVCLLDRTFHILEFQRERSVQPATCGRDFSFSPATRPRLPVDIETANSNGGYGARVVERWEKNVAKIRTKVPAFHDIRPLDVERDKEEREREKAGASRGRVVVKRCTIFQFHAPYKCVVYTTVNRRNAFQEFQEINRC